MSQRLIKGLTALFALLAVGVLSGCNTMEGLGKDTQELGKAIEREATEHD